MVPLCCPRCRLLQDARVCIACGEPAILLEQLTRPRVEGLTTVRKPPPRGWRDAVALLATVFGMLGSAVGGALMIHPAAGVVLGSAVALLGYHKQFWKAAIKRRPRLAPVAARARPAGPQLIGIAELHDRTVVGGKLAIATTIETEHGVLVRAIDAAPFWLVAGDRRVLITGACWVAGLPTQRRAVIAALLHEIGAAGLPLAHAGKAPLRVTRVAIAPGDRIAVIGPVREEQIGGAGGYRDALVEAVRGEPGALVWIERLEAAPARPR